MRVRRQQGLELGWFCTQLIPNELSAVFVVKATFALGEGTLDLLQEGGDLVSGDVEADEGTGSLAYASDFVPYKPNADLLVRARACAPGAEPVRYLPVGFRVGGMEKELLAVGDRRWKRGLLGASPGEPEPFTELPLTWERAFGGDGDSRNPVGVGRAGDAMPNVEWPNRLLRSPKDQAEPAALGPVASSWEPRKSRMGTYRGDYLETRWPWYPEDLEWSHFSSAPEDQQVAGYLRGDEELAFRNLHPTRPEIEARLPGLQARCFATFADGNTRPVDLVLDTMFADLERERIVLVWRGRTPAASLRLKELEQVFALLEPIGTEQPLDHYMALRDATAAADVDAAEGDEELASRLAQLDAEAAAASARATALDAEIAKLDAEAEAELAAQRQWMLQQGLDADVLGQGTPRDLATAQAEIAAAIAQLKATSPDFAPPDEQAAPIPAPPPEEGAPATESEPDAWTRERVVAALAEGASLQDADLRGLDLREVDFSGARMPRAVLGEADLTRATFAGADLDGADFSGSTIEGATFRGASIDHTTFDELALDGLDFTATRGVGTSFADCALSGCNFDGADLPKADFGGSTLTGATFRSAKLVAARFGDAKADRIDCSDADMSKLHAGDDCDFSGAVFRRARLDESNFTGAILDDADLGYTKLRRALLTEASICRAELSRADLARAVLDDADLRGARMLQANLLYCSMERVDLSAADARAANLYASGLWQAKTEATNLEGANLNGTRLEGHR